MYKNPYKDYSLYDYSNIVLNDKVWPPQSVVLK